MNALKILSVFTLASMVGWLSGCGDDGTRPEPPPPPPPLSLEIFNTSDGLPSNDVFAVLVDSRDRLWFTTEAGVAMDDGTGPIQVFNQFNNLPNIRCRGIAELNGKIFVGTWGGGLAVYADSAEWTQLRVKDGLVAGEVADLAVDRDSLFIATVNGMSRYTDNSALPMSQRWTNLTSRLPGEKILTSAIVAVTQTRQREVWVGSMFGWVTAFRTMSPRTIYYRPTNSGIPGANVNDIAYNSLDDTFWIAFGGDGVASVDVDAGVWTHYTTVDGLPSDIAYSIAVDQLGTVWVGTQKGVGKLRSDGTFLAFPKGSGLPDARVRRVYVDPQDRVWLAFVEGGAGRVLKK